MDYSDRDRPSCLCTALFLVLSIAYLLTFYFYFDYIFWPLLWLSVSTTAVYGLDKILAIWQCFRVPELILHLLGVCGGWPGAQVGMIFFHHKTSKLSFQVPYRVTAAINIIVFAVLAFTVFHLDLKNNPWQSQNSTVVNSTDIYVPALNNSDLNMTSF